MKRYEDIKKVPYAGASGKDPFTFRHYDADAIILGKPMREHLKFAMSWWHTINAGGTDMFGGETLDKSFGKSEAMAKCKAKADFAFELMEKLGIGYYCFHDADVAPEGRTLAESTENLNEMAEYLLNKQKQYGVKLLWGTANMFSDKKFMAGAATSSSADVFALAAGKVKAALDATIRLGGNGYVFWGGREGYDTLINSDVGLELDNLGRFLILARDYGRKNGFAGDFYIEPKPKEPTKHQYDFDVATCVNFLRKNDLIKDFRMNVEANHATLAGHTFQHELRMARVNGVFGSIDANQGDLLLGWDTDQFPTNVYDTTLCMLEVLQAGGFTNGGLNFDAKARRASNTFEDILFSYIAGMDAFALGLKKAAAILEDGRIPAFVKERYASYNEGIGLRIAEGKETLASLYEYAKDKESFPVESGRQEYLESIFNDILFS
ncbi:MAG: Xylose isomerase [Betaproteobacteria bacterium ADurb.Bin341]|nr:MAG: Xylose isomerase [Betaproteobacteria bacterium ADurb.Bin341]HOG02110.1 xylose isomerase [Clostridia bacterium]HPK16938.1 xylose isomerase [Clostridia bacterium]